MHAARHEDTSARPSPVSREGRAVVPSSGGQHRGSNVPAAH